MELKVERLEIPEGCNIIFGQTHFIKTVEDLYEIMMGTIPNVPNSESDSVRPPAIVSSGEKETMRP